jgi:hypothetical protein
VLPRKRPRLAAIDTPEGRLGRRHCRRPVPKPREEATGTTGAVVVRGDPWRGQSPREARAGAALPASYRATDFHGGKSPGDERGPGTAMRSGTVRADVRRAGLAERRKAVPWKGKPPEGENPGAYSARNKAERVSGGKTRQGSQELRRRSVPGRGKPREVASRFLEAL